MPDAANPDHADTARWRRLLAGRFIVFEGPDGSGKSTQLRRLVAFCEDHSVTHTHVREPGGTPVGEAIRDVLLHRRETEMLASTEMLLYMASRAELVAQRIRPALERDELVIADRFVSSTLAYQGSAGGVSTRDILDVARVATAGVDPHLVVIFDVDQAAAAQRLGLLLDRMEAKGAAFHARVREGYLQQAKTDPDRHLVIDATRSPEEVWAALLAGLDARLGAAP
ncbi:MAG: dTMP kinase [Planctomycetota bacterium]